MSITDELRNWMENAFTYKSVDGDMFHKVNTPWFGWKQDIEEMLDRIDATYEEDVNTACKLANALSADELNERGWIFATDENMAEHGWVRLPVDADDVPIHVGDEMEFCAFDIEHPVIRTVDGIGKDVFFAWCGERGYQQHDAKRYRHYTPPTVEDVLFKACKAYHGLMVESMSDVAHDMPAPSEVIAEYAAKLRLAGEDE